jgi:hypothetical protein
VKGLAGDGDLVEMPASKDEIIGWPNMCFQEILGCAGCWETVSQTMFLKSDEQNHFASKDSMEDIEKSVKLRKVK